MMKHKYGIALILVSIFLVLFVGVDTYLATHSIGLRILDILFYVISPILCLIGFILAMMKE